MIHFSDKFANPDSIENHLSGFKDIKPMFNTTADEAQDFWKGTFESPETLIEEPELTLEEIFTEVYGRSEDEFTFDFDTTDKEIQDVLSMFSKENWSEMDLPEQEELIKEFADILCKKIGITDSPNVIFFEDKGNNCGYYNNSNNIMAINTNTFNNPKEVVDTIAHEVRHKYQFERAGVGETHIDKLYAYNLSHYIEPKFFIDYQDQLVEAEARAFAKLFAN